MIRRSGILAGALVVGLALKAAAEVTAPPAASTPAAAPSPAPSAAATSAPPAGSAPPEAPASTPPVGPSPAVLPSGSPTANPYHYIVTGPQSGATPQSDDPAIIEIALNERTLEVPGPVLVRVTTSPSVGAVTARVWGREMGIPQIAPGVFGGADQLPRLPWFLRGRSYDVEFVASTRDGRSASVTLPVGLR